MKTKDLRRALDNVYLRMIHQGKHNPETLTDFRREVLEELGLVPPKASELSSQGEP